MAEIFEDDVPPKPGPRIEIVRIKANQACELTVYSIKIHGYWTHWLGSCSGPCFKDRSKCPHCKNGMPRRWKGYLYCWLNMVSDSVFIELTPTAAKSIRDRVGPVQSLRGYRMTVTRGNGNKAWLKVDLKSRHQDVSDSILPDPISPTKTLMQLWGLSDGLGETNDSGL